MNNKRPVIVYTTPKGNITINKVYKNELFVFTTKSMLTLLGFAVFAGMLVVSRKRA